MNNLSFYLLNAEESLTASTKIKEIINDGLASDEFCMKVLPFINQTNSKLAEAISKSNLQHLTLQLSIADDEQDAAFIGFRDYVKAFTNNPDKAKQTAAEQIQTNIKTIGWTLWSEGYINQSALLESLFQELDKEENLTAMNSINATEWYDYLKTKHESFKLASQQKNTAEAERNTPTMSKTKKELAQYMNPLLAYIELMAEIDSEAYAFIANKVDGVISEVMTIARARQTRKENAITEE